MMIVWLSDRSSEDRHLWSWENVLCPNCHSWFPCRASTRSGLGVSRGKSMQNPQITGAAAIYPILWAPHWLLLQILDPALSLNSWSGLWLSPVTYMLPCPGPATKSPCKHNSLFFQIKGSIIWSFTKFRISNVMPIPKYDSKLRSLYVT